MIPNPIIKKPVIVTGLDIGSSKIAAVSAQIGADHTFRILAQVTGPSRGISKGVVIDLGEAIDGVSKVLSKLREKISVKPGDIYVNVSGVSIRGEKSRGMVPLSLRGREVTRPDMDRCVNVASVIRLPFDREILQKIVHNYSVDDQSWIKSPLGLYASRLSCEIYVITCDINHIQNIHKVVNSAGYDVKEIVYTGIADGYGLMEDKDKEKSVVLMDMGSNLTEISVFSSGTLTDVSVMPVESRGSGDDYRNNPQFIEMISKVAAKTEAITIKEHKAPFVMITGGLAFSDGIVEFLEERLSCPVKMGVARDVRGEISSLDSVRLVTAIGLARFAYSKYRKRVLEDRNIAKRISDTLTEIFNYYF